MAVAKLLEPAETGLTVTPPGTVADVREAEGRTAEAARGHLKRKTARGVVVSTATQAGLFVLRTGSLLVLARILLRSDFGVVNMATAFIGFFGLARDGLSMGAVQRTSVTREQTSNLFWVNLGVGGALALLTALISPLLASFYGEPRLRRVVLYLATILIFNSAGAQHRAMLQRGMRFAALAAIDLLSWTFSIAVGIGMAVAGFGYWSLVAMMVGQPAAAALGVWLSSGWIPGWPSRQSGVRSMLAYGGAISLNSFIAYVAYNADKVLVGRFWGADALGMYGRAYQLINLPNENLNTTIGLVAFPAMARVHEDPRQLANYFSKGFRIFASLTTPLLIGCALFAGDIILVALGPKWTEATRTFRLLVPAIWGLTFVNPFGWLMLARGLARRCITIAVIVTPIVLVSYALGLKYGPEGVAAAFSIAMLLSIPPVVFWARHGTLITMRDILRAATPAAVAIGVSILLTFAVQSWITGLHPGLIRLIGESTVFFGSYSLTLLYAMKQKATYVELLREIGLWPSGSRVSVHA